MLDEISRIRVLDRRMSADMGGGRVGGGGGGAAGATRSGLTRLPSVTEDVVDANYIGKN